ncbi:MAG: 5'/3'-nucleotidase SurE [Acidobacteria bacterium]|nr:5'/3'-nucleotidase SurE [Acidobacteriota bacterium]
MKRRFPFLVLILTFTLVWAPLAPAQDAPAEPRVTILLSNDDGYDAPGLKALAEALAPMAQLVVSAPATDQSGTGHGITYREPIMVNRIDRDGGTPWYSIAARPATCVRLGIEALVTTKPDLVISGINRGENLGVATFLSGTLGAAREAAIGGLPAVAVSMGGNNGDDYKATAAYVRRLVEQLQAQKLLHAGFLLNVNVPAGVARSIKGVRITKLSLKAPQQGYERRTSPRGQLYFWSTYQPVTDDAEGTDVHAFEQGYITVTPLSLDNTNTAEMEALRTLTNTPAAKTAVP